MHLRDSQTADSNANAVLYQQVNASEVYPDYLLQLLLYIVFILGRQATSKQGVNLLYTYSNGDSQTNSVTVDTNVSYTVKPRMLLQLVSSTVDVLHDTDIRESTRAS